MNEKAFPVTRIPVMLSGAYSPLSRTLPGAVVAARIHVPGLPTRLLPEPVRCFVRTFDFEGSLRGGDPAVLVDGGIDDDKGCLVPA